MKTITAMKGNSSYLGYNVLLSPWRAALLGMDSHDKFEKKIENSKLSHKAYHANSKALDETNRSVVFIILY